jgi:hypothetical protein
MLSELSVSIPMMLEIKAQYALESDKLTEDAEKVIELDTLLRSGRRLKKPPQLRDRTVPSTSNGSQMPVE